MPTNLLRAPTLDTAETDPPRPRHALLINPFYKKDPHASFGKHVLTPSLALTAIAGATPEDWEIRLWDENLLQGEAPNDPFPAVVGITVHLTFAERAYQLADWYRARGAQVVLGGLHIQSCPEEAAPHADALALGEGVAIWPTILKDAEQDRLKPRYCGSFKAPYHEEPTARRAILDHASYLTTASLIATRGCHNRCDFCYLATDGLKMPYQMKKPEQIVREFRDTKEPYGVFVDNNLGSKKEYLRRLCRALRPIERIWSAAITIDVTDDPELVEEMAAAGCTGVFVGFESLNGQNLLDAHKKTPLPEDYARRVDLLHQYGIQVNASFVLGLDHDGPDVFQRTVDWVEENRLECSTFHIATPYPATPFFSQLEAEGRILHRDWSRYDTAHCVFQPARMSPAELEAGYAFCYEQLFSHRSIWKRRPLDASAVPSYLAMSYLYKRANWLWPTLIKNRLTHRAWRPLVEIARRRHVHSRRRLLRSQPVLPLSPGV